MLKGCLMKSKNTIGVNLLLLIIAYSLVIIGILYFLSIFLGIDIKNFRSDFFIAAIIFLGILAVLFTYIVSARLNKKIQDEKNKTLEIIDRYEALNNATREAIWDHDLLTGKTFYNNRLLMIFGYSKADLTDNETWWFDNTHPQDRERVMKKIEEKLKNLDPLWQDEYRFRCKDGTYKIVNDRSYIVRDITGKPIRLIGAMNDITAERKQQEFIVTEKLEYKNKQGKAIIQSQEEERKVLRELLHEDVNQILASIKLCIHQITNKSEADVMVNDSISQLDDVINKIRKISDQLSPSGFEYFGLIASIKDIIALNEKANRVDFSFNYSLFNEAVIDKPMGTFLYRILADMINNMFFDAGEKPTEITIEIKNIDKQILISIADNCRVTDLDDMLLQRHIDDIKNKLEMYNGEIDITLDENRHVTAKISL
jgi:PAS domain S-box-containing protein